MQRQADIEAGQLSIPNNNLRNLANLIKQIDDYNKSLIQNETFQESEKVRKPIERQVGVATVTLFSSDLLLSVMLILCLPNTKDSGDFYKVFNFLMILMLILKPFCVASLPYLIMRNKIPSLTIKEIQLEDELQDIIAQLSLINAAGKFYRPMQEYVEYIAWNAKELNEDMQVHYVIKCLTNISNSLKVLLDFVANGLSQPLFNKQNNLTLFPNNVTKVKKKEGNAVYATVAVNDNSGNEKGKGKEKVKGECDIPLRRIV